MKEFALAAGVLLAAGALGVTLVVLTKPTPTPPPPQQQGGGGSNLSGLVPLIVSLFA